jgi:hypothetical protein
VQLGRKMSCAEGEVHRAYLILSMKITNK